MNKGVEESRVGARMRGIIILLLLVSIIPSVHPKFNSSPESPYACVLLENQKENITFGIFRGGTPEIPVDNFSVLIDKIKGVGFYIKNITDLTTMEELDHVHVLVLLTHENLTDEQISIIKNYTFLGGNLLFVLPSSVDDTSKRLLEMFGLEIIGSAEDNESYYEKESYIIVNGSWENVSITRDINSILVVNASALNYTGNNELLDELGLNETMPLDNETNVSILYVNKLIWGGPTTYVEYKKGKKTYGQNVTFCYAQEYYFGSRIVVVSSGYMFENLYVVKKDFDNLKLLENIILWLGEKLNRIDISVISREPNETTIDIDKNPTINVKFRVTYANLSLGSNTNLPDPLTIIGFEYLGKLKLPAAPEPKNESYDEEKQEAYYYYDVDLNISALLNRSAVVFIRIMSSMEFYGFKWSESIRIEAIKKRFSFMKYHITLLTILAVVLINLVAIVLLFPYATKIRKKCKEYESKMKA